MFDYGCVPPIEHFLEWDMTNEHYQLRYQVSAEDVEQWVANFNKGWEKAD